MRIFYAFWFFFCAGWGYLFPSLPPQEGDSVTNVLLTLPISIIGFAALAYFSIRGARISASNARLSFDLKPWHQPIGVLQFVMITFTFVSFWAIGFSVFFYQVTPLPFFRILSLSFGGLVGVWAACRLYRALHAA